jgi:RNA recognition motif-containing protein
MSLKIFVGSIPTNITKQRVLDYFAQYGELTNFSIVVKPQKGKDHKCGILNCQNEQTLNSILKQPHSLDGNILDCHRYLRGKRLRDYLSTLNRRNVYVTNMPYNTSNKSLSNFFENFGAIQNVRFLYSKKRYKEKYAIITFEEEEVAQELLRMKKVRFRGGWIKLKIYKDKKMKIKNIPKKPQQNKTQNFNLKKEGKKVNILDNGGRPNLSKSGRLTMTRIYEKLEVIQGNSSLKNCLAELCLIKKELNDNSLPYNLRFNRARRAQNFNMRMNGEQPRFLW